MLVYTAPALPQDTKLKSREELNLGVQAYKDGRYAESVQHFQKALELDPANQNAELYLATAFYIQWVPGGDQPENERNHELASRHFNDVLAKDSKNPLALAMLASMAYNQAAIGTPEQKAAALEEAKKWNERRIEANPKEAEPYYYLGVIAWAQVFTPIQKARVEAAMLPADPGPFKDPVVRSQLQSQFWAVILEGIDALEHCLQIDKENEDAMSYMNLLLRKKADLEDSPADAKQDVDSAGEWAYKARELKKLKAARPPKQ